MKLILLNILAKVTRRNINGITKDKKAAEKKLAAAQKANDVKAIAELDQQIKHYWKLLELLSKLLDRLLRLIKVEKKLLEANEKLIRELNAETLKLLLEYLRLDLQRFMENLTKVQTSMTDGIRATISILNDTKIICAQLHALASDFAQENMEHEKENINLLDKFTQLKKKHPELSHHYIDRGIEIIQSRAISLKTNGENLNAIASITAPEGKMVGALNTLLAASEKDLNQLDTVFDTIRTHVGNRAGAIDINALMQEIKSEKLDVAALRDILEREGEEINDPTVINSNFHLISNIRNELNKALTTLSNLRPKYNAICTQEEELLKALEQHIKDKNEEGCKTCIEALEKLTIERTKIEAQISGIKERCEQLEKTAVDLKNSTLKDVTEPKHEENKATEESDIKKQGHREAVATKHWQRVNALVEREKRYIQQLQILDEQHPGNKELEQLIASLTGMMVNATSLKGINNHSGFNESSVSRCNTLEEELGKLLPLLQNYLPTKILPTSNPGHDDDHPPSKPHGGPKI